MTIISKNFTDIIAPGMKTVILDNMEKLQTILHHDIVCRVCHAEHFVNGISIARQQPCRFEGFLYNFPCYTCMGTGKELVFEGEEGFIKEQGKLFKWEFDEQK